MSVTDQRRSAPRDTEHVEGARAVQRALDRRDGGGSVGLGADYGVAR